MVLPNRNIMVRRSVITCNGKVGKIFGFFHVRRATYYGYRLYERQATCREKRQNAGYSLIGTVDGHEKNDKKLSPARREESADFFSHRLYLRWLTMIAAGEEPQFEIGERCTS